MYFALSFIISASIPFLFWVFDREITWKEAVFSFLIGISASGIIYATTFATRYETAFVSGWTTQKMVRDAYRYQEDYTYSCNCHTTCSGNGKNRSCSESCQTCHGTHHYSQPETYYFCQDESAPKKTVSTDYRFPTMGDRLDQFGIPKEHCTGDCSESASCDSKVRVDQDKLSRVKIGDPTVWTTSYWNPMKDSQLPIFFSPEQKYPYPQLVDYDKVERIIGCPKTQSDENELAVINSTIVSGNAMIICSKPGEETASKVKQEWHNGRKNDFIVVLDGSNGSYSSAQVVGWDNESQKYDVIHGIKNGSTLKDVLASIKAALITKPVLEEDFSQYSYLEAKTPLWAYVISIILQMVGLGVSIYFFRNNDEAKNS